MSIPTSNAVLHAWDDGDLPELASVISTIKAQPGRIISRTTGLPANTACSFPPSALKLDEAIAGVGISASDVTFQDLVFEIVAKSKKMTSPSNNFGHGMGSFLPYFVSTCISRCFSNATFHDNTWIALHEYSVHDSDFEHLVDHYIRAALVVTLPISHISYVDQAPEPPDFEGSVESADSGQPYDTLSDMLAQEEFVEEVIERYDWKDTPIAPNRPAMNRVVFAADSPVPALSVIVVAERDVIGHVMLSALYHRLAWGLRSPLLGLSFSRDSSLVDLHVGWLDDDRCPDKIPRAHLLGSGMNEPQHRKGLGTTSHLSFYLDDTNDALVLGRILLSLRCYIEADCEAAQLVHQDAIIHWRADQQPPPLGSTQALSHQSIADWSKSIVSAVDPNALLVSCEVEEGPIIEPSVAYSFDQFVALKERRGISPTAVSLWLLDRFVVSLPLPPIATSYILKTQFTILNDRFQCQIPMFNLYRSATCFKWPRAWQNIHNMPPLPHTLSGLKAQLCGAIQSDRSRPLSSAARAPLSQEADLILEQELSSVLQVCSLAQSLKEASPAQPLSYCYDMLFSILPTCDTVQLLPSVNIRLSRSVLLDEIAKGPTNSVLYDVHDIYSQYFSMQTAETQLFEDRDEHRYHLLRSALQRFGNDAEDWHANWSMSLQRAQESPTVGTCDSAIAARFRTLRRPETEGKPASDIVIGQSQSFTCPVSPLPFWSSPEFFSGYSARQRILTYDIMATSHHDYPTPSSDTDAESMELNCISSAKEICERNGSEAPQARPQDSKYPLEHALDVPVLFVVHSAQRVRFHIADSNRLRMCLTSAVRFLASLQILDFPLFGLLTEGTVCAVVMAWCTRFGEEEPFVHLVDLNCASYDISVPAGALNLVTFLLWLHYEHVPQLLARLEEADARGDLTTKHGAADGSSTWSAEDQLGQVSRGEPPFDQADQATAEDQATSEDSE